MLFDVALYFAIILSAIAQDILLKYHYVSRHFKKDDAVSRVMPDHEKLAWQRK